MPKKFINKGSNIRAWHQFNRLGNSASHQFFFIFVNIMACILKYVHTNLGSACKLCLSLKSAYFLKIISFSFRSLFKPQFLNLNLTEMWQVVWTILLLLVLCFQAPRLSHVYPGLWIYIFLYWTPPNPRVFEYTGCLTSFHRKLTR